MDETPESAAEYFKRSLGHQLKHQEKLIEKIPFKDTDNVFEIGCGTAAMSVRTAKEIVPKGQVTACDPEKSRIRFAMDKFSDISNLHLIHATGSAALANKADLYDVIISNAVLHWMTEDELKKTIVNMFNALKSGGIAAHNFLEDMPSSCHFLRKIDEKKIKKLLEIFHPIEKAEFAVLAREVGFVVGDYESCVFKTEFDTVGDLLKTVDASTFGLFGWEKAYNDANSKGVQVEFDTSDDGKIVEVVKINSFVLKKP